MAGGGNNGRGCFSTAFGLNLILTQESHPHAILTRRWQRYPLCPADAAQKMVGDLQHDARAVAGAGLAAAGPPMIQIGQYGEGMLNNTMGFDPFQMSYKAHAAGVMLVAGVVQALSGWGS